MPNFGCVRAGDETRTRDIQLGKLVLYQLSYARVYLVQYRKRQADCKESGTGARVQYFTAESLARLFDWDRNSFMT